MIAGSLHLCDSCRIGFLRTEKLNFGVGKSTVRLRYKVAANGFRVPTLPATTFSLTFGSMPYIN